MANKCKYLMPCICIHRIRKETPTSFLLVISTKISHISCNLIRPSMNRIYIDNCRPPRRRGQDNKKTNHFFLYYFFLASLFFCADTPSLYALCQTISIIKPPYTINSSFLFFICLSII